MLPLFSSSSIHILFLHKDYSYEIEMAPTIVLITGANRGIGKGLLELYLLKPNHLVIAANRNPEDPTSKALAELPTANGTSLLVVKNDATVRTI